MLLVSATSMIVFQLCIVHSITGIGFLIFLARFAQALSWPNCAKILSSWLPDRSRNLIFGIFGSFIIFGSNMEIILPRSVFISRQLIFIISPTIMLLSIIVFLFFEERNKISIDIPKKALQHNTEGTDKIIRQINPISIINLKLVKEISFGMFCLKFFQGMILGLISKGFYSSLPLVVGSAIYSGLLGFITDRKLKGTALNVVSASMLISSFFLASFFCTRCFIPSSSVIWLSLAGTTSFGCDYFLGGSIAAEFGEKHNAISGITGIVNGFGFIATFLWKALNRSVKTELSYLVSLAMIFNLLGSVIVFKADRIFNKDKSERAKGTRIEDLPIV
ncbi:DgyrCDS14086 [Dimorphilus gyrociliatus]|nr:DgyrCDS14086 [Dimorphilus gyrociliatus]